MQTAVTSLVVIVPRTVRRLREDSSRPRSEAERARDSRTELVWLLVAVLVVGGLVLAYWLTRGA